MVFAGPLPLEFEPGPAGFRATGRRGRRGAVVRRGPPDGAPEAPVEVGLARLLLQGPLKVRGLRLVRPSLNCIGPNSV